MFSLLLTIWNRSGSYFECPVYYYRQEPKGYGEERKKVLRQKREPNTGGVNRFKDQSLKTKTEVMSFDSQQTATLT